MLKTRRDTKKLSETSREKQQTSYSSQSSSPSVWGVQDGVGIYPSTKQKSENKAPQGNSVSPATKQMRPSALPPQNRFLPQHEPRKGEPPIDVIGSSALQFVPAFEESTFHSPENLVLEVSQGKKKISAEKDYGVII
mmetsp:Transcript_16298/g.23984  ORF Transcript_16298/g.23984 Transcript_16298/m.23984 type:complete len:137 (-) Transcript_16298:4427-4837(-)